MKNQLFIGSLLKLELMKQPTVISQLSSQAPEAKARHATKTAIIIEIQ